MATCKQHPITFYEWHVFLVPAENVRSNCGFSSLVRYISNIVRIFNFSFLQNEKAKYMRCLFTSWFTSILCNKSTKIHKFLLRNKPNINSAVSRRSRKMNFWPHFDIKLWLYRDNVYKLRAISGNFFFHTLLYMTLFVQIIL